MVSINVKREQLVLRPAFCIVVLQSSKGRSNEDINKLLYLKNY